VAIVAVHQAPSLTREQYEQVVRRLTNGKSRFETPVDVPFEASSSTLPRKPMTAL
jgi:hypothetical protein